MSTTFRYTATLDGHQKRSTTSIGLQFNNKAKSQRRWLIRLGGLFLLLSVWSLVFSPRQSSPPGKAAVEKKGDRGVWDHDSSDRVDANNATLSGRSSLRTAETVSPNKQANDTTTQQEDGDLPSFNFCTASHLPGRRVDAMDNQTTGQDDDVSLPPMPVFYPCVGPAYDAFAVRLHDWVTRYSRSRIRQGNRNNPHWGRRRPDEVLPRDARVLVWGNSHLRQVAHTLACQGRATRITHLQDNAIVRFDFAHMNATMVVISGSPIVYSSTWRADVETLLGPLSSWDAVILGHVETCDGDDAFSRKMQNLTQRENCLTYPTVQDWRIAYPEGPLVFVTSFSASRNAERQIVSQELHTLVTSQNDPNPHGLELLIGREYIVRHGLPECAATSKITVSDCKDDSRGQRCTGAAGGHADILAWDVTEFLHRHVGDGQNRDSSGPGGMVHEESSARDEEDANALLPDVQWCQKHRITARNILSNPVQIYYQCAGPLYKNYTQYIQRRVAALTDSHPTWGRRRFAVPANKRVLFWGNSHTRQVVKAISCQQEHLGHLESHHGFWDPPVYGGLLYRFSRNATVYNMCNTLAPYTVDWQTYLERSLDMPLQELDAIVLGFHNVCRGDNRIKIEGAFNPFPDLPINCTELRLPTVADVAAVYKGPILFVSMFDNSREDDTPDMLRQVRDLRRDNAEALYARRYLEDWGAECLSPQREAISDCGERVIVGDNVEALSTGHACTGPEGGVADLASWDVVEFLHRHLVGGDHLDNTTNNISI